MNKEHCVVLQFFRLLTAFVCDDSCPRETVDAIVDVVLSAAILGDSVIHVLQFLVAAAETHSHLYPTLSTWAVSKLNEDADFSKLTVSFM